MKVNFMKSLILSAILLQSLIMTVPEAQANLLGHNVQFNATYAGSTFIYTIVNVINPGIEISCPSPTAVGPGCGANINGGGYTIDFQDNDIIFDTSAFFSSTYGADRNYLLFTILDPGYIFTNASLGSSNIPGLTSGRITFTTKTVTADFSGLPAPAVQATDITVQVGTGAAGPQINPVTNPLDTTLDITGSEINNLALAIDTMGILNILNGGLVENLLGSIDSSGAVNNSGIVSNMGTITNELGAALDNLGTIFNPGTMQNIGSMLNELNATVNNQATGSLSNFGGLSNLGTISNAGSLISAGTLTNALNALLDNNGSILNSGTLQNIGSMLNELNATVDNQATGVINNLGDVSNNGSLQNNGSMVNELNATMTNYNLILNDISGYYKNVGQILNGVIGGSTVGYDLVNKGILDNDGIISNSGTITNDSGTVNVSATGSITGAGTYNQISGSTTIMGTLTQTMVEIQGGLMQIQDAGQVIINQLP